MCAMVSWYRSPVLWSMAAFILALGVLTLGSDISAQDPAPKKQPKEEEEEPVKKPLKKLPKEEEEPGKPPDKKDDPGTMPPRRMGKEEEEEPVKVKPRTPLRVEEEEPAAKPGKAPARPLMPLTTDLVKEAQKAKNPAVRDLFRRLAVPHDIVTMRAGRLNVVEPIPQFVGPDPVLKSALRLQPFDARWKYGPPFVVTRNEIAGVDHYEHIVVKQVSDFLNKNIDRDTAAQARLDLLLEAEKPLSAAVRFHEAARERGLREGQGWDDLVKALRDKLVHVQVRQLEALGVLGNWEGAFELADRLTDAHPKNEDVYIRVIEMRVLHAEKSLQSGKDEDFREARRNLERLDRQFPNSPKAEPLRRRLRDKAADYLRKAQEVAKTDKVEAIRLMRTAEQIWPQLPNLQDSRLDLENAYPILYVGVPQLPDHMSPAAAVTDTERLAMELLFESLVKPLHDPRTGLRYEPALAQGDPRLTPLGRQFQITREARWSNGELVTAADVHGTVRLLRNGPGAGSGAEWAELLAGTRVEGPFQVRLTLQQGFVDPLSLMSFKVLPASTLRRVDDPQFARRPIGSGPYQYQGRERDKDIPNREYAVFRANPNYGSRAGKLGQPRIREIRLYRCEDPVPDFRASRLHLLLDLSLEQLKQLKSPDADLRNVSIQTLRNRRVHFLAVNHRKAVLRNQLVRQAIAHAFDREQILSDHFRLDAKDKSHRWVSGPYPRGSWACNAALDGETPFRPTLAKALADKAQARGLKLTLKYPSDDERRDGPVRRACEYIRDQVRNAAGIEIELKPRPSRDLRHEVELEHDYELAYYHHDHASENYWLWPLFDPAATEPGGKNYLGYVNDADLEGLFRSAMSHRQFSKVQEHTRDIHDHLFTRMPIIPLWQLDTHIAIHGRLKPSLPPGQLDPLFVFTDIEQWRLDSR